MLSSDVTGSESLSTLPSQKSNPLPVGKRFHQLDGLRGVASVAVFLWHHFIAFFPASIGISTVEHSRLVEKWLYRSPLAIFFAGDFAVYVFFALSGFVISVGLFRSEGTEAIRKSFLRRYMRLMPPALFTMFIGYLILSADLNFNNQAGPITEGWWLAYHWSHTLVSLKDVIWMGIYQMWFIPVDATYQYNSNLGTLALELIGSFVIFGTIIATRLAGLSYTGRMAAYGCLIAFSMYLNVSEAHYVSFYAGMVLADVYVSKPKAFVLPTYASSFIFALAIYLGAVNVGSMSYFYYAPVIVASRLTGLHPLSYSWTLASVLLVYACLTNESISNFFASRPVAVLGKYSFPLFLAHTIVLCSFTSFVLVLLNHMGVGYRTAVAGAFLVSLPIVVIAVKSVHVVDVAATRLSRHF